jgi:hypothetical protein
VVFRTWFGKEDEGLGRMEGEGIQAVIGMNMVDGALCRGQVWRIGECRKGERKIGTS